jgi:hypothetical protein
MRHAYSICIGKHEGKGSIGKPRSKEEDNIKVNRI